MDTEQKTETVAAPRNASWGAIISIVVILAMITIGAFYSWGKRIDQERVDQPVATSTQNQ
jgi:hypothetical protein